MIAVSPLIGGEAIKGPTAKMMDELGMPAEAVAPHLMFAAGFNAAGGTYTTAFPALGTLHHRPDLRARLAEELDGFSGPAAELDALPFLDALEAAGIACALRRRDGG